MPTPNLSKRLKMLARMPGGAACVMYEYSLFETSVPRRVKQLADEALTPHKPITIKSGAVSVRLIVTVYGETKASKNTTLSSPAPCC